MSDATRRVITSPSNRRVKELVGLRKHRVRAEADVVLVEGYAELQLAVAAGSRPSTVFLCTGLIHDKAQLTLLEACGLGGVEVVELSREAFNKASLRESPDGWLAVLPTPDVPLERIRLSANPLVLVCEAVEKPGNLGAMLRTAEATRVDAVIAASAATDWGNPNVVRASKGTVFAVQVSSASADAVLHWLTRQNLAVVLADPHAPQTPTDADLGQPRLAIVVGSESAGASRLWRNEKVTSVRLPMAGRVDSLNVSVTAAVLLYEAFRQRGY